MNSTTNSQGFQFNQASEARFVDLLTRYPNTEAALIPALWVVQDQEGWVSEPAMEYLATRLDLPISKVLGVATFYTMFKLEKGAAYDVAICHNISCWLNGSEDLLKHACKRLGIKVGETTSDGKIALKRVECLASCGTAPVVQVNKDDFVESMTPEKFDRLIDSLK